MGYFLLSILLIIYLLPALQAYNRRHRNRASILIINVLLGWTFVGWAITLAWAYSKDVEQ